MPCGAPRGSRLHFFKVGKNMYLLESTDIGIYILTNIENDFSFVFLVNVTIYE